MILGGQKYPNTTRTISGLLNIVYDNDVVLLCDTTAGAVQLELAQIPAGFWNSQYKLYVVDKSGNASVNNITIKAPTGFTVNNASTFVLNVNNGTAIIRIANNTNYMVGLGYGAGAGSIVVQDEGTTIAPNASTLNFVGAGVNATAVGNVVTVNIAGTAPVTVTNAQLLTLISGNTVLPNTWYLVSDAIFTFTTVENVPILVQGVTTNSVSLSGSGIFLNADYQNVGDYSGVTGFIANIGVWNNVLAPVIGNVVIWNNLHFVNITGVNGVLPPNVDAANWTLLAKTATNGYILEVDDIQYNPTNNQIFTRSDKRLNVVENNFFSYSGLGEAFLLFQWGNNQVQNNSVLNDSCFELRNNPVIGNPIANPKISFNKLKNNSRIVLEFVDGLFSENSALNTSDISVTNDGNFLRNNFVNESNGVLSNVSDANVIDNTFDYCQLLVNNSSITSTIFKNNCRNTTFTITNTLDCSENTFVNSLLNVVSNTNKISKNNLFESKLQVTVVNSGQIVANDLLNSEYQIATNTGNIGNNRLALQTLLSIANQNTSDITRNDFTKSNVIIGTNTSTFVENIFKNSNSINITSNTGVFRGNIFDITIVGIVSNTGTIQNNNCSKSVFTISVVNDGTISENIVNQSSQLVLGTNAFGAFVSFNSVIQDSSIEITTNNTVCSYNYLSAESRLQVVTNNGSIGKTVKSAGNRITNKSVVLLNLFDETFVSNTFDRETSIIISNNCSGDYTFCQFNTVSVTATDQNGSFTNLNCDYGQINATNINIDYSNGAIVRGNYNSITIELDLTDPSIYDLATQTLFIPTEARDFAGRFLLKNAAGQVIKYIKTINGNYICEFFCDSNNVVFNAQTSIPHIVGYIVADVAGNTTVTGRTLPSVPDSIIVQANQGGFTNAIVEKRIFA